MWIQEPSAVLKLEFGLGNVREDAAEEDVATQRKLKGGRLEYIAVTTQVISMNCKSSESVPARDATESNSFVKEGLLMWSAILL